MEGVDLLLESPGCLAEADADKLQEPPRPLGFPPVDMIHTRASVAAIRKCKVPVAALVMRHAAAQCAE